MKSIIVNDVVWQPYNLSSGNGDRVCVRIRVDSANLGEPTMPPKQPKGKPDMPATEAKLRAVRLELPEDVHKLLRIEAARRDMSLADLARALVTEVLTGRRPGGER